MSKNILYDINDDRHQHHISFQKSLSPECVALWKRFSDEIRYDYSSYLIKYHDIYSKYPDEILSDYQKIEQGIEIPLTADNNYKIFLEGMRNTFPEGHDAQHFLMYLLTCTINSWDLEIQTTGLQFKPSRKTIDKSEIGGQVAFFVYAVQHNLFAKIYPQYEFEPQIIEGFSKTFYFSEMEKRVMQLSIKNGGVSLSHYNLKPVKQINSFFDNFSQNNNDGLGLGENQEYLLKFLDYYQLQKILDPVEKKGSKVKI